MRHCTLLRPLATMAAAIALAGCAATTSPDYDMRFGDGWSRIKAAQLLDPDAPQRNASTVPRTDGRTLRDAMETLGASFRNPPPTNVINIGVGAGGNGR